MRSWLLALLVFGLAYSVMAQDDVTAEEEANGEGGDSEDAASETTDANAEGEPDDEANTEPTNNGEDDNGDDNDAAPGLAASLALVAVAVATLTL